MTESDPLSRLETVVHKLTDRLKELRSSNNELEQELNEARKKLERIPAIEASNHEQEEEIARLQSHRDEARRRVEALLENVSELEL